MYGGTYDRGNHVGRVAVQYCSLHVTDPFNFLIHSDLRIISLQLQCHYARACPPHPRCYLYWWRKCIYSCMCDVQR